MRLEDIYTTNWQLGLTSREPALDVDDINQSLYLILLTRKGEAPLNPHFGCGLLDHIDRPVNSAVPRMKKEILDAIRKFEPRIEVLSIKAEVSHE